MYKFGIREREVKEMLDQKDIEIIAEVVDKTVEKRLEPLKSDVNELKSDVNELRSDVNVLKSDVDMLKGDVSGLKEEVSSLRRQSIKNTAELKAMDNVIFDEVERVHEIMLKRTDELDKRIG